MYDELVRAQRRYAEKLSVPGGTDFRFTTDEWARLGEDFGVDQWEGAFADGMGPGRNMGRRGAGKENVPEWKGKEKAADVDSEDEDVATLTIVF